MFDSILGNYIVTIHFLFFETVVPGVGGNRLQAKLNKPSVVSFLCSYTSSDFYDLWLDAKQMLYGFVDCWVDNIRMTYDPESRTTSNSPGVDIRVPGWSSTDTMEWIDTTYIVQNYDYGAYYTYIVNALVDKGYQRGKHLFGAPYDFRKGPSKFVSKIFDFASALTRFVDSNQ